MSSVVQQAVTAVLLSQTVDGVEYRISVGKVSDEIIEIARVDREHPYDDCVQIPTKELALALGRYLTELE